MSCISSSFFAFPLPLLLDLFNGYVIFRPMKSTMIFFNYLSIDGCLDSFK